MANDSSSNKDAEIGLNGRGAGDDSESQSSQSTRTKNKILFSKQHSRHCSLKWLILPMVLLFSAFVVLLVYLLGPNALDNESGCHQQLSPIQQNNYKLFATKTLYTTAYQYLSKHKPQSSPLPNPSAGHHQQQQINTLLSSHNYDKSSIYVPNFFSPVDSLDSINRRLQSPEVGCKVKQLHFIGRHAARLPNEGGIERINGHLANIQSRIDLDRNLNLAASQSSGAQPATILVPNESGRGLLPPQTSDTTQSGNRSAEVCHDPLGQYKQWVSFAAPSQGNHVSAMGVAETRSIAARFKSMFPEMFDASRTKVEFGTTRELRTGQTALEFMKLVNNYTLDFCRFEDFPTATDEAGAMSSSVRVDDLERNSCFSELLQKFNLDKLSFHDKCKSLSKKVESFNLTLHEASRTESISRSLSKKLKLPKNDQLSKEEVRAIYDACRFESALKGQTSIWCNLFQERELRLLEYISDVDDFYSQAYGDVAQMESSCPVTQAILSSLSKVLLPKQSQKQEQPQKPEAKFYFTHSEVIQKILAASVDLSEDSAYRKEAVPEHLARGEAPKERQWQTSLLTPFSANIAFTLYWCPNAPALASTDTTGGDVPELDVTPAATLFKVVASLNEQPIRLGGCPDYVCDLNHLLLKGRIYTTRTKKCDLEEFCRNKVVVT